MFSHNARPCKNIFTHLWAKYYTTAKCQIFRIEKRSQCLYYVFWMLVLLTLTHPMHYWHHDSKPPAKDQDRNLIENYFLTKLGLLERFVEQQKEFTLEKCGDGDSERHAILWKSTAASEDGSRKGLVGFSEITARRSFCCFLYDVAIRERGVDQSHAMLGFRIQNAS